MRASLAIGVSACLACVLLGAAKAAPKEASGKVTVSFVTAQSPVQMALWVEDATGQYVRTLYVTRWEAKAGWKRGILPQWVAASEAGRKDKPLEDVDGVTQATPKAGTETHTFSWDLKDFRGKVVPQGKLVFKLQCDGKRGVITWSGKIMLADKAAETVAKPAPEPDKSNTYVKDVKIRFTPA